MIITNNKALNGMVIITIMGEPPTDQEDIILEVEILTIDHTESKTMDISMLHPQEVILGRGLVEEHGEVNPIPDEHMVEVNLPIKMTTAYLVKGTLVIKGYHNIDIFVVCAQIKAIMTTSVITHSKL